MLSGKEIIREIKNKNIVIKPFDEKKVNPNSYNMRLDNKLYIYENEVLDCKKENPLKEIIIPNDGLVIKPGEIYLAPTKEYTENPKYVPQISGRSSIGRVGISVHMTAGFGSVGFKGSWTLGITCTKPVRIYPGMEICQIYYFELVGDSSIKYSGKYSNNGDIMKSKFNDELNKKEL